MPITELLGSAGLFRKLVLRLSIVLSTFRIENACSLFFSGLPASG
jgi:hypothetical protein